MGRCGNNDPTMKLVLNAAQNTFPHNKVIHTLNNCEVALKIRQYNDCHDAVLEIITLYVHKNLPPGFQLIGDLITTIQLPTI